MHRNVFKTTMFIITGTACALVGCGAYDGPAEQLDVAGAEGDSYDSEVAQHEDALFGIGEKSWNGCEDTEKTHARAARKVIVENWGEYEHFVEKKTGLNVKDCLENRFKDNGKVECENSNKGTCDANKFGWASSTSQTMHICPLFFDKVNDRTGAANIRASYAALMAHEWGHTCWRNEKNADAIDRATFDFYKDKEKPAVTDTSCVTCKN